MSVNSISPGQPVQSPQALKRTEAVAARKQSEIKDTSKVNDKKDAAEQQALLQKSQLQKAQEPAKPAVNTSGQKIGTLINTAA